MVTKNCNICNKEYKISNFRIKISKYCSRICLNKSKIGKTTHSKINSKEEAFEKYVIRINESCWDWKGALCQGYGHLNYYPEKNIPAHRVSWRIHYGNIPNGMHVLHKCDNRKCTNPNHLFLGTNADNVKDKINKGRQYKVLNDDIVKKINELYEANTSYDEIEKITGISKRSINRAITPKRKTLTKQNIIEIKKFIEEGTSCPDIAKIYGVNRNTIYRIRDNKISLKYRK